MIFLIQKLKYTAKKIQIPDIIGIWIFDIGILKFLIQMKTHNNVCCNFDFSNSQRFI